ncbi:uncharacterized protein LOC115622731 [Scaptodrosophila lebanonensis]|uniref:Uncharacterized protein LOC115622731 n=1 Tax=Drosophila lebanonensis TaxID=7225 RepID=A0A6J2TCD3_DROLE|nr:uncharacterized protein LOC115622731 [Scaptodrosophila lebanonensis]
MDCAPLNLAHFHERRSQRFMARHRYEEAAAALDISLLYLSDAYKNVTQAKSREVLDTQKWEFERKLRQIEIRKKQHGLTKLKDYAPLKETSPLLPLRPEQSGSAQSVAKAIDKTVQDFDAKFTSTMTRQKTPIPSARTTPTIIEPHMLTEAMSKSEPQVAQMHAVGEQSEDHDIPSLAPLELPSFDFTMFTSSSAPSLASYAGMAENFQK